MVSNDFTMKFILILCKFRSIKNIEWVECIWWQSHILKCFTKVCGFLLTKNENNVPAQNIALHCSMGDTMKIKSFCHINRQINLNELFRLHRKKQRFNATKLCLAIKAIIAKYLYIGQWVCNDPFNKKRHMLMK